MRDTLSHRGPDGFGTELLENETVALGHRRLSIIDLSEKGKQPMCNEDGSIWITFNGEIYNYKKLHAELLAKGHRFQSGTDTEVLIHGYEQWGIEGLLSRIKGMFAFGIYDGRSKNLYLARDRFGIKPLFYHTSHDGREFIFASELKAILKSPDFKRQIDISALQDYLVYRFIPSPKSIWQGVCKLPPAHYLQLDLNTRKIATHKYWSLKSKEMANVSFDDARDRVDCLLRQSVREHLESDVPVGVFLSGGYDSGAVMAYLHELEYTPSSFSIGFDGWGRSEHEYARMVAERYQSRHTEKILKESLIEDMEDLMFYYDEPIGGSSFLPTFQVSQLAARQVKVAMAGDGGDEVFGGYNWYYYILSSIRNEGFLKKIARKFRGTGDQQWALEAYFSQMSWAGYTFRDTAALLSGNAFNGAAEKDLYKKYFVEDSLLKSLQATDFGTFMPEVILNKVDRASMACSLEVRVPFLDHELVEYMFSLPDQLYYKEGVNKHLLREIIKNKLPKAILDKEKTGFGAPVNRQSEILKVYRQTLAQGALEKSGIFNRQYIEELLAKGDTRKLWPLYILELWFKKWY